MNRSSPFHLAWRTPAWIAAWAVVIALSGCGGVGVGGTGSFASAEIAAFGSIVVAGVEYDDAPAVVQDEDGAAVVRDGSELQLGMTVDVIGTDVTATAAGARSQATTIRLGAAVVGPIEAVDATNATLTVYGQTVQVNASTLYGPGLPRGFMSLRVGDVVTVYGLPDATSGTSVATRIDTAGTSRVYRVSGIVQQLDPMARTFAIGAATFSYASAASAPSDLTNGRMVRIACAPGPRTLAPTSVTAFASVPRPLDGEASFIRGLVTTVSAGGVLTVGGNTIDVSRASIDTSAGPLTAGAYVNITGSARGGTTLADHVTVINRTALARHGYDVAGSISAVDVANKTIVVRNTLIDVSNATFTGGAVNGLLVGARVRASGALSPDGTRIVATTVTFF